MNILDDFLAQRQAHQAFDWSEENIVSEREQTNPRLVWRPSGLAETGPKIQPLNIVREGLPVRIEQALSQSATLIKAEPGVGKTHAAVQAVQRAVDEGKRILWAAGRHDMYGELQKLAHFDESKWYHFLPMQLGSQEKICTCRYAPAQSMWINRGYASIDLCKSLCSRDRHMEEECVYRRQAKRKEPIVFAMHQHLVYGTSIKNYDAVVVDELPLSAFLSERIIPLSGIRTPGVTGPLADLQNTLIALGEEHVVVGRQLFDVIGPILRDVFAQIEVDRDALPLLPEVADATEVAEVPYWYVFDFLLWASLEYEAWQHGWAEWLNRIKMSKKGLHLLSRRQVWSELPDSVTVLDATGDAGLYQLLFEREFEEYAPRVERQGKIRQVTHRLHHVGGLRDEQYADELVGIVRSIAARYAGRVGVVSHLAMRSRFEELVGEDNVAHYYGSRGANGLEGVEALIVAGTPHPALHAVFDAMAQLYPDRIKAFGTDQDYTSQAVEYRMLYPGSESPWREVRGYWSEPELQMIFGQMREAELLQALHRGRVIDNATDVWVLSPVPTGEYLDDICDDPPVGPDAFHWRQWLKLEAWLTERWHNWCQQPEPVTYALLADQLGQTIQYLQSKKALDSIADHMSTAADDGTLVRMWEALALPNGTGRPVRGLYPSGEAIRQWRT